MSIKTELKKWLRDNVPGAKGRVMSNRLRQRQELPAIVLETDSALRTHTISGDPDDTRENTFSLDCMAEREDQSEALADEVEGLDGYLGQMGVYHVHFRVEDRSDDYFDDTAGQDKGRYITTVDVSCFYTEN